MGKHTDNIKKNVAGKGAAVVLAATMALGAMPVTALAATPAQAPQAPAVEAQSVSPQKTYDVQPNATYDATISLWMGIIKAPDRMVDYVGGNPLRITTDADRNAVVTLKVQHAKDGGQMISALTYRGSQPLPSTPSADGTGDNYTFTVQARDVKNGSIPLTTTVPSMPFNNGQVNVDVHIDSLQRVD